MKLTEDEVDTGELLESLDSDSGPHAKAVASRSVLEALEVAGGTDSALVVKVGGDLGVFLVNLGRVDGGVQDARKSALGLLVATLGDEVACKEGNREHMRLNSLPGIRNTYEETQEGRQDLHQGLRRGGDVRFMLLNRPNCPSSCM